jgi:hypothetical protein
MSAKSETKPEVTKTKTALKQEKTALKQETYNLNHRLSDLKRDPHCQCGFVEFGDSVSESVSQ